MYISMQGQNANLWLFTLFEECLLSLLVLAFTLCEISLFADLVDCLRVETFQLNLQRCSDHITSIYSSKRYTIDFEWTSYQ